jgi:NTE family protein
VSSHDERSRTGAVVNVLHALTLLISRQLMNELQGLDHSIDCLVVPPLCPLTGSPYGLSRTSELIERAEMSTDAWLSERGLDHPRACTVEHAQAHAPARAGETK